MSRFLYLFFTVIHLAAYAQKQSKGLIFNDDAYNALPMKAFLTRGIYDALPSQSSLKAYCPTPGNQNPYGTCVGWATSYGARTILWAKQHNITETAIITQNAFSPDFVYRSIVPQDKDNSCEAGTQIHLALQFLKHYGDVFKKDFFTACPSAVPTDLLDTADTYKIKDFATLFNYLSDDTIKIKATKKSLAEGNPVTIGMLIPPSLHTLYDELWSPTEELKEHQGGHALCVIGYDDNKYGGAFEVMNSWGTNWGKGGFFWVKYNDFARWTAYGCELINNIQPLQPEPIPEPAPQPKPVVVVNPTPEPVPQPEPKPTPPPAPKNEPAVVVNPTPEPMPQPEPKPTPPPVPKPEPVVVVNPTPEPGLQPEPKPTPPPVPKPEPVVVVNSTPEPVPQPQPKPTPPPAPKPAPVVVVNPKPEPVPQPEPKPKPAPVVVVNPTPPLQPSESTEDYDFSGDLRFVLANNTAMTAHIQEMRGLIVDENDNGNGKDTPTPKPKPKSNFNNFEADTNLTTGKFIAYRMDRAYTEGTRFRLFLRNNEPAYVYAIAMDNTNQAVVLFPYKANISPALNYKNNEVALPSEDKFIKMDNVRGTDIFCLLYAKEPLDIQAICRRLEQETGTFFQRLYKTLQHGKPPTFALL
jgi:hypothetical protein